MGDTSSMDIADGGTVGTAVVLDSFDRSWYTSKRTAHEHEILTVVPTLC